MLRGRKDFLKKPRTKNGKYPYVACFLSRSVETLDLGFSASRFRVELTAETFGSRSAEEEMAF